MPVFQIKASIKTSTPARLHIEKSTLMIDNFDFTSPHQILLFGLQLQKGDTIQMVYIGDIPEPKTSECQGLKAASPLAL